MTADEQCAAVRTIHHSDGTTEGLYCAGPSGHFNRHWAYDPIRRAMVRWGREGDPVNITDHAFLPVAGCPDDDECTNRSDGTDDTYCGLPEHEHEVSLR